MEYSGQYLTYEEYRALGGTLDLMPFNVLEYEARKQIDKYTFGRLQNLDKQEQETKMCIQKLISTLENYKTLEVQDKTISSESIDGYSVTYAKPTKDSIEYRNSEIRDVIRDYLFNCKLDDGTPYLYTGAE